MVSLCNIETVRYVYYGIHTMDHESVTNCTIIFLIFRKMMMSQFTWKEGHSTKFCTILPSPLAYMAWLKWVCVCENSFSPQNLSSYFLNGWNIIKISRSQTENEKNSKNMYIYIIMRRFGKIFSKTAVVIWNKKINTISLRLFRKYYLRFIRNKFM